MFKKLTKKKTSKQLAKMSSKENLYTEDDKKLLKTQSKQIKKKKEKYSKVYNINNLKNANAAVPKRHYSQIDECFDSSMLKTKEQNIKKKKKEDSKVQKINNLINDDAVAHTKKRQYSQMNECFVLLSDCNEHIKNHKSDKASTYNNTKNSAHNDKDYSSLLKTKEQNIKKKKKEESKVQKINSLINDNAIAHIKERQYSQMRECFVLLSDCNEHKKNHKSDKASTRNNTKNSSENDKDYSSMLKTKEQSIQKKKKEDSKVQNINSLINDDAVAHTKKRQYSQMNECFVLLSDCSEHIKNHKPDKDSTRNNSKNSSENDKDYSSILKTQRKNIKNKSKIDSKVQKINNLINDDAVAHTKKRQYSQMNECFVLLSDCNEHIKNHKSDKASTYNNTKNSAHNDKDYSSLLKTKEQNIKKKKKEESKVQKINSLINDNAIAHIKERQYSQMRECFVLLSDCNEHKKNHKSDKASTRNNTKNSSENDKDYSSMLKTKEQSIQKKKKEDSKVQNINSLINDDAVAHTKKRQYSQMNECFVLLSDCSEHIKNHKPDKDSTRNNSKNSSENDKDYSSILKTQRKNIKNKSKIDSKVQKINNLINDDAVAHTKKRQYSQMNECFVLLSDCNEHIKNHKSDKASTYNNTKNSAHNDKDYSSLLKTKEQNIKKKKKEESKVQKINSLINDNAIAHIKERQYSQMRECFVLLSDCNEHKKNHKSDKASTRNNTKNSSENDKDYSSMLKTKEQSIQKKKKEDSKVQNINSLINDDAVAHTKKRQYSQMNECFVLLSDCSEHIKNHKSDKDSTRNNSKNSSEKDKDDSSIFKTRGKKIKINNKYKIRKINNLENHNAAIHTEKRHSQLKECFVLLSDCNKNKKIIHKPNKASSRKKTMIGSENNKEYLSMSKI